MASNKTRSDMDPQEEIVRLLAIQIRRAAGSQAEAIQELGRAGFPQSRIADLLGTTAGTVNQALIRAKSKQPPGRGASGSGNGD
jgi:DNA-directed RNA polymerase specialized sigma24 family protein